MTPETVAESQRGITYLAPELVISLTFLVVLAAETFARKASYVLFAALTIAGASWADGPLLVRPRGDRQAVAAADLLLRSGGFRLVVLAGVVVIATQFVPMLAGSAVDPARLQRNHAYVFVGGGVALQVPAETVRVWPTAVVPVMAGRVENPFATAAVGTE